MRVSGTTVAVSELFYLLLRALFTPKVTFIMVFYCISFLSPLLSQFQEYSLCLGALIYNLSDMSPERH